MYWIEWTTFYLFQWSLVPKCTLNYLVVGLIQNKNKFSKPLTSGAHGLAAWARVMRKIKSLRKNTDKTLKGAAIRIISFSFQPSTQWHCLESRGDQTNATRIETIEFHITAQFTFVEFVH